MSCLLVNHWKSSKSPKTRKMLFGSPLFQIMRSEALIPHRPFIPIITTYEIVVSVQFSCSFMSDSSWHHRCSMQGLPIHFQLPEFTQTHVHWVGDAIQPSHPLSSLSPPTFNLCQHQGLFQWVSSSHLVAKVLEFQLQHQCFQWIFRTDFL